MKNKDNAENILKLAADMQKFGDISDELTDLVNEYDEDELSLDELDLVSAASSAPTQSLDRFIAMMKEHDKNS